MLTVAQAMRYSRPGEIIQEGQEEMARGPLYQETYTPQFSGHETFPLRYGWLKKVYDRVAETAGDPDNRAACWDDSAIARFGVGKNMVSSMRHWAKATGIVEEPPGTNTVRPTPLGEMVFKPRGGFDPYMEHPATLWLIHWQLAAQPDKTTWFWAFSHYPAITFERDKLAEKLGRLAKERQWTRVAMTTIKNDVACFIRTYVARQPSGKSGHDDALECPLTELGLIKAVGRRDGFRFARGPKPSLTDGVFIYALLDFWIRYSPNAATLAFETIAHAPGSPGRVFAFDENDLADRLTALGEITNGQLQWSESAGLKQVVRNIDLHDTPPLSWLVIDHDARTGREAA